MKRIVPIKEILLQTSILSFLLIAVSTTNAQSIGGSSNGLVFKDPTLKSGNDLKKGAVYLFKSVAKGVYATISIDDLVNGASVKKIDDNSGGLGYGDSFQPEIQIGGKGESYAQFTISFIDSATGAAEQLKTVQATSLDIDGNSTLKEFAIINMNGGTAAYMGTTLELTLKALPILNSIFKEYRADNKSGIEHDGIDTSGKGVMYTVSNSAISSFTVKYGATSTNTSNSSRQYSLYMMGFQYPSQIILPLELLSFTTSLETKGVDVKWTTNSEKNVSHFVVERSADSKSFSDVATVFAYGNTTRKENYIYTDNIATVGSRFIYYRLRCVDIDGKYTYSPLRVVRIGEESAAGSVLAYPNPFTNEIRLTLPKAMQGNGFKIELFNTNGQVVKMKNAAVASQTETITTTDLQRGFYVIRVTSATEKVQYKVIKN